MTCTPQLSYTPKSGYNNLGFLKKFDKETVKISLFKVFCFSSRRRELP